MFSVFSFMDPLRQLNIDHILMEILHGIKQHQNINQMNSQSIIQFQILEWKKVSLILKKVLLSLRSNWKKQCFQTLKKLLHHQEITLYQTLELIQISWQPKLVFKDLNYHMDIIILLTLVTKIELIQLITQFQTLELIQKLLLVKEILSMLKNKWSTRLIWDLIKK
jgi:hypothetical protein